MGTFAWDLSTGNLSVNFRLIVIAWETPLDKFRLDRGFENVASKLSLRPFVLVVSLGTVAYELCLDDFRLKTAAWELWAGNLHLGLSLGILRLGTFAWHRSLGIFRMRTFSWDLPLGTFSLGHFRSDTFAWDLSLRTFAWAGRAAGLPQPRL